MDSIAQVTHLFTSFSGLLHAFKAGKITEADLGQGLFYFGCTREHAMDPGAQGEGNELSYLCARDSDNEEEALLMARQIHLTVMKHVTVAEAEGRVGWRTMEEPSSYEQLNELLAKHGLPQMGRDDDQYHYNYPTVEERLKKAGSPLKVVWRG